MKIVDANVLLYVANEDSRHHAAARAWLDDALSSNRAVGLPWAALTAFVRVSTLSRVFDEPLSPEQAMNQVDVWLSAPAAVIPEPTPRHVSVLRGLLMEVSTGGNLVHDAHLAALAVEHGAEMVTFDTDFLLFKGVPCELLR